MKRLTTLLVLAATLGLTASLSAHGGTYKGPGDTVPPGGGGASTPTPPSTPSTPSTPGSPAPGGAGPTTGGAQADSTDLSKWQFWWEFNKDRFLNLRAKVHSGGIGTDTGGALTGLGGAAAQASTFAPTDQQIRTQIIPALLEAVQGESDQDILTGVMIALAKIGKDESGAARALFLDNLDAPVQEVAETAAISYGILKDFEAMDSVLVPLLKDDAQGRKFLGKNEVPLRNRTFAAYGIALIGSYSNDAGVKQKAAKLLLDVLATDKSAIQDLRVASAIGLGLLDLKEPGDIHDVVTRASTILTEAKDDDIVLAHLPTSMAKLLRGLPPDDLTLRNQVLDQVLGLLDARSKAQGLTKQSAVMALGMLARPGDPRSKEIFEALEFQADKAKDQQAKNFSAISMAYLGAADPDFDSAENKAPITKFLLDNMKKSNSAYEQWSGLALGVMAFMLNEQNRAISPVAHEQVLKKFEDSKSPDDLSAYVLALGLMNHQGSKDAIRTAMEKYKTSEFRGYASISLGLLGAREHRDYLAKMIEEQKRDPDLLKQAAIGLGLMKDREVLTQLMEFLNPKDGRPSLAVLAATATAIGFIGDSRSVEDLVNTLKNKKLTPLGRAFAAVALGMVGDKELMPWNSPIGADMNYRASVSTLVEKNVANGILDIL